MECGNDWKSYDEVSPKMIEISEGKWVETGKYPQVRRKFLREGKNVSLYDKLVREKTLQDELDVCNVDYSETFEEKELKISEANLTYEKEISFMKCAEEKYGFAIDSVYGNVLGLNKVVRELIHDSFSIVPGDRREEFSDWLTDLNYYHQKVHWKFRKKKEGRK